MNQQKKNIHEKIKLARVAHNLTQEEMAEKLNLSVTGYAKIERGENDISSTRLEQIANVFNLSIVELLLFGEKNMTLYQTNKSTNSHHQYLYVGTLNNMSANEQILKLNFEIEKLQLIIENKDFILNQKEQEIKYLKLLLEK